MAVTTEITAKNTRKTTAIAIAFSKKDDKGANVPSYPFPSTGQCPGKKIGIHNVCR